MHARVAGNDGYAIDVPMGFADREAVPHLGRETCLSQSEQQKKVPQGQHDLNVEPAQKAHLRTTIRREAWLPSRSRHDYPIC